MPLRFGELGGASGCTPPRQAEPDTPPEEGNCRYGLGNLRAQAVVHHPVGRSPTPLHRRGISWYRTHTTTPSGFARHPSRGGELPPPQEGNCCLQRRGMVRPYWRGPSRNTLTRRRMLASTGWSSDNKVPQMGCPVCNLTGVVSVSGGSTHSSAYLSAGYWFAVPKSQFLVSQPVYVVVVGIVGDVSIATVCGVLVVSPSPLLIPGRLSQ